MTYNYETNLNFNDDWNERTGQEVQDFIKHHLERIDGNKVGYFHSIDGETSNTLLGFKSEEEFTQWNETQDSELVISSTVISKGEPQPYKTAYIQNLSSSNNIISIDNNVKLNIKFVSLDNIVEGGSIITNEITETGELVIERRTGTTAWVQIDKKSIESNKESVIDITNNCLDGEQQIRIYVVGTPQGSNMTTSPITFNVTKTKLILEFTKDWTKAQSKSMEMQFRIMGIVNKILHITVSGPGGNTPRTVSKNIGTNTYDTSIGAAPYSISLKDTNTDLYKVLTHGVHNIEAWLEVVDTKEETEHINFQIMMNVDSSNKQPYLILNNINNSPINWSDNQLFEYCIYDPVAIRRDFSMVLSNYNTREEYLKLGPENIETNKMYSYSNIIEIEGQTGTIYAPMEFYIDDQLVHTIECEIQNDGSYGPTQDAHFILDPKSRSNNELMPDLIYNKATGAAVNSVWNGFNFNSDGWVQAPDGKCLRLLAGQTIEIDYNPYLHTSNDGWKDDSCTIEMVVAVRNIVNPDIPILRICNYDTTTDDAGNTVINKNKFNGIEMIPNSLAVMTPGQNTYKNQDIVFREDKKIHIAINYNYHMYSYTDTETNSTKYINLVRIYVNGKINREFSYTDNDIITDNANTMNPRKIVLGHEYEYEYDNQGNILKTLTYGGADLDIYSMRIYKKKLDTNAIFNDYISSLTSVTEKDKELEDNDITVNGVINYAKAKEKYNTLLWKPLDPVKDEQGNVISTNNTHVASKLNQGEYPGNLEIRVLKEVNGNMVEDTARSGIIKNLRVKGQGTSSMTYWKWNQRWEFDKLKDSAGEKIKSKFYANDGSAGIGSWLVEEGCPRAKRIDGKINWASPMQSHKLGSTSLYHDLWKKVVGDNAITSRNDGQDFTGTPNGYGDCRVAIKQLPFMLFEQQEEGGDIVFVGLYTVGASKGDKPTFGYNKDDDRIKPFIMMEGTDNGAELVNHRIPWNDVDVTLPPVEDEPNCGEVYKYNGTEQWEISMGDTEFTSLYEFVDGVKTNVIKSKPLKLFKDMCNFVYLLNPNIYPFDGSNINDENQNAGLNLEAFYWLANTNNFPDNESETGPRAYDLYRYHAGLKKWVNAGIERVTTIVNGVENIDYERLNLKDQVAEFYVPKGGTYADKNNNFIDARVKLFAKGIGNYLHIDDLRYTMMFLKLIAASDNWAKNTYLYSTGLDENGNAEKFRFFQDDLDTIFATNNTGQKTKPYYVEEHDLDENDSPYWNANTNALYCLAEKAWPVELRNTMYSILKSMAELSDNGTVEGCFDKYYNFVPKYFPAVAYNEIARILYEDAKINKSSGKYDGIEPLSQCLGDQLEAEKYWQNLRIPYLSSYAMYGEFEAKDGVASSGYFTYRSTLVDGAQHKYKFELTPYMWLYPSFGKGSSDEIGSTNNMLTRCKAGETYSFPEFTTDGNTNIFLRGINYYTKLNDFGNIATALTSEGKDISLSGKRLTEFKVTAQKTTKGILFRPEKLTFASNMTNLTDITITGAAYNADIITGELDLSSLWKLKNVDLSGTKATQVTLPQNSNIKSLRLPNTINRLSLDKLYLLNEFNLAGYSRLISLSVADCPNIDTLTMLNKCMEANSPLESISMSGINWANVSNQQFNYILNIPSCNLIGTIELAEDAYVDFNTKMKLLAKFGNIDDPTNSENSLYVSYRQYELADASKVKINGQTYIHENGIYKFTVQYPSLTSGISGNDFVNVEWDVENKIFGNIDTQSGEYQFINTDVANDKDLRTTRVTCKITRIDGSVVEVYKEIYLYQPIAQVGDYVYADGTYSSPNDMVEGKQIIGVCFYVGKDKIDEDPATQRRLAVAIELASEKPVEWGPGIYDYDSCGINHNGNLDFEGAFLPDINETLFTTKGHTWTETEYQVPALESSYSETDSHKFVEYNYGWENIGTTSNPNYISYGKKYTDNIIKMRNMAYDSSSKFFNDNIFSFDTKSRLDQLIDGCTSSNSFGTRSMYFPAASYAVLYQPNISNLNSKFEKGKWYLPSIGELCKIYYYMKFKINNYKGFDKVKQIIPSNCYLWSSSEQGDGKAHSIGTLLSSSTQNGKMPGIENVYTSGKIYGCKSEKGAAEYIDTYLGGTCYVLPVVKF